MRIATVRTVLPDHYYEQREITEAVARWWTDADRELLERFHTATRVAGRSLALPIDEYVKLEDFGTANDTYIDVALDLAERAVRAALDAAGLAPTDVDHLVFCSSTGLATPSLDARLSQRVGMRDDVKRVPVFGLGCAAGAAGLSRLHDYLRAWPEHVAVLTCVELCSLTVQPDDSSLPNLVGSGLFADGAAAVAAFGDRREPVESPVPPRVPAPAWGPAPASAGAAPPAPSVPVSAPVSAPMPVAHLGPRVVASRSKLYPNTERLMGWDVGEHGFRIVLAADLVDTVEAGLASEVTDFLGDHGLALADVASWVCHPGGPKVIETIGKVLDLDPDALALTWGSLRRMGNLSSVSVLNVLEETISRRRPAPGDPGLLMALGPGFSAELVLLRW